MDTGVIVSLILYALLMLGIGYWSYRKTSDVSDYMLGGRGLGPAVTALSAGASDMSQWMLMALPGALYTSGLSGAWIAIGLTIGAYVNYLFVAPRLRVYTEVANDSITVPDYLENRFEDGTKLLRLLSGLFILIFFTLYVSSGLVAGGKLFNTSFNVDYRLGIILTILIVVIYTFIGGFLAVSTTDFVQGCIMFVALVMVPIVVFTHIGGDGHIADLIRSKDPDLLNMFSGMSVIGIISLFAWGLGYFGQPHIIVRFMAIRHHRDLKTARRIGIGWMVLSLLGAVLTGLCGIAYYQVRGVSLDAGEAETVFIRFANVLFNPYITGFLLAAVLAAIMSTISSQLLVSSSAVTEDFYKTFFRRHASQKELVLIGRLAVVAIAVIAILLSLTPNNTILNLVGNAWAGFGATFGPLILVSLYWKRMTNWGAIAGMLAGGITVIIWLVTGWFDSHVASLPSGFVWLTQNLYAIIPGFIMNLIFLYIFSKSSQKPKESVMATFEKMLEGMRN